MKSFLGLLLIVTMWLSPAPVRGQTVAPRDYDDVVRFRSNEVRLDVIVRDKRGRPIKDLKSADFEIFEDGVPQKVESFRFISKEAAPAKSSTNENQPATTGTTGTTATPPRPNRSTPTVTALVFDRLSPEARALARKAGLAYAQEGMAATGFTGVFGIDQALRTFQTFTDDALLIKDAVENATSTAISSSGADAGKVRANIERSGNLDQIMSSSAAAVSAAGAARDNAGAAEAAVAGGQAALTQQFVEMQTRMLEQYELLERDQEGHATINSLLAVISPMQKLPGRKTIIFFSEGLKLPPTVQQKFPAVINAANRANVSIYSIDAAGLRIESGTAEAARELNSIAAARMAQMGRPDRPGSGPYMRSLERNEDLLRFDPRSGLGSLSEQTGGFLIHDTNDLVAGLHRIDDDMNGYYFLTYVPQNKDYDGRFRRINVKVGRPNVEVQSRRGYYAVEAVGQLPMLDYEAPAIAAARNWKSGSSQNSVRSTALSYPVAGKDGLTLVLAEAQVGAFKFVIADNKTYSTDFSIVALVRDESDRIVQKVSQHYALTGVAQDLDAAKKGTVLFYRETQLPPGKYRLQVIAHDTATGQANVSATLLEIVSADDSKPRLSSVAVLKRAERLTAAEQQQDRPLRFGELLVYPNLGERIDRSAAKQLVYFFTAWPGQGATRPLQVTLEILQNNRQVGKTSGELPPADERGQIKYASSFPLDKFSPGVFELKVTVSDGVNSASRSTSFNVGP
jgi:VWFA-related protein